MDPYNSESASSNLSNERWIKLNVGGKTFLTSTSTLLKNENSMLARMFSPDIKMNPSNVDEHGAYLIDRSPEYFEPILNYLRHGQLIYNTNLNPEGILEEARFFGVDAIVPQLESLIKRRNVQKSDMPLTRRDVITALIQTSNLSELRFQGVNLTGADLRKLDFRRVNFKYAILHRCNLSHANLSYCCLERADLSYSNLEAAQLFSVRGLCANMESANLVGCNFEDPTGTRSNLEGVNLKNAVLENSNMAGVNLRVANLKYANMKNCNLRAAVLAGADLEVC